MDDEDGDSVYNIRSSLSQIDEAVPLNKSGYKVKYREGFQGPYVVMKNKCLYPRFWINYICFFCL